MLGTQDASQRFDVLLHDFLVPAGLGTGRARGKGIELYGRGPRLPDKHFDDAGRELRLRHKDIPALPVAHGPGKTRNVRRRRLGVCLRLQNESDLEASVVE